MTRNEEIKQAQDFVSSLSKYAETKRDSIELAILKTNVSIFSLLVKLVYDDKKENNVQP